MRSNPYVWGLYELKPMCIVDKKDFISFKVTFIFEVKDGPYMPPAPEDMQGQVE